MVAPHHVAWTAYIPSTSRRFWSGDEDLTFQGETWEAAVGISIQNITDELGNPTRRARASFRLTDDALRVALFEDIGPTPVELQWIYSADRGISWNLIDIKFVGRLSKPTIINGTYVVELETYTGSVDRGRPIKWSHEYQMTRNPNRIDTAFKRVRSLESGAEIEWPP